MKLERHSQIIRLISQYDIETQEELAQKLNESGFHVTQATVSRDIRELKLTKIARPGGGSRYAVAAAAALDEMNFQELVGCIAGDNTIMCAMRSADEALLLMEKIRKMLDSVD